MFAQLTLFFSAITTLAIVHTLAIRFFLYWKYTWFDIPMHILGGICIALGISILPFFKIQLSPRYTTIILYIIVALVVGILWEIFEFTFGISVYDETFVADTISDLFMDVVGGAIGYSIVQSVKKL
jgi:hypothetical protein